MRIKFVHTSIFLLIGSYAAAFAPSIRPKVVQHRQRHIKLQLSFDDGEEDWKAFRARLIQNSLPKVEGEKETSTYAHTTPFVELGSILVSIPTTDLCQAVDQQYWHRAVAIITQCSNDVENGSIEDEVPDEQLAQGAKRGRWSYRGLLLNRLTNLGLECDGDDDLATAQFEVDANSDVWRIHRGGDLLGLESASQ